MEGDLIYLRTTLQEIYASYDMLRKARGMTADSDLYSKFRTAIGVTERLIDPTVTKQRSELPEDQRLIIERARINCFLLLLRSAGGSFAFTHDEMQTMRGFAAEVTLGKGEYRFQLVRKQ